MTAKRIILYIVWYGLVTFGGIQIYLAGLHHNTQGAQCMPDEWHYGAIYQWIWDGEPCMFSAEFLIGYLFYLILYLLFDYIRRLILKTNPSLKWRCMEVLGWLLLDWGYVLRLTATEYGKLDLTMCMTSLLGAILFFWPFFAVALGAKFIKKS